MTAVTPFPQTDTTTLLDLLATTVAARPDAIAVRTVDASVSRTWTELDDRARRLATGLRDLGVRAGDTVGVMLTNDIPFYEADLAVVLLGAVPVPLYATSSAEQIAHIEQDANLRLVITQEAFLPPLRAGLRDARETSIVCVEADVVGTVGWDDLVAGDPLRHPHRAGPGDLLTVIYTSGTTGPPKGVELTNAALVAATAAVGQFAELAEGGRVISWLPLAHIAERIASYYAAVAYGLEVVVCPDPKQVAAYLPQVQPSFFFAVPRFWEKLRAALETKVATLPQEQQDAFAARAPAFLVGLRQLSGFGALRIAAVGAAPSDPEMIDFFHGIGIPVGEIYGSTESAACCTANPAGRVRVGSAGLPMPGVEVRIAEDGEVETRGPSLMRGYRNLPERTAEALTTDGWLRTGDIGRFDDDGYLWIFDRKSDVMISAGGKNMSPANIEAAITSGGPEIGYVCVVGDRQPYNVALIMPDHEVVGLPHAWPADLEARIAAAVELGNTRLNRAEQIKRYHLVRDVWEPGSELLTPTLKMRRMHVRRFYQPEIAALYGER